MVDLLWHLSPTLQKVLIPQNGTMEKSFKKPSIAIFQKQWKISVSARRHIREEETV